MGRRAGSKEASTTWLIGEACGGRWTVVAGGRESLSKWKYWVSRKLTRAIAKNARVTEPLAAVKRGLGNRLRSTMGFEVVRSRAMKTANTAAASAKLTRVR